MRKNKFILGIALVGALVVSSLANASMIYATSVENIVVGTGQGTANDRDNINNLFGAPDGQFYELGIGGRVDLLFGSPSGQLFSGNSFITEVTFGNPKNYPEAVDIYAGFNGNFTFLTTVLNSAAQSGFLFEVNIPANMLRLIDSTADLSTRSKGGFDIDSIGVTFKEPAEVSAPATLGLLGLSLFGFAAAGRLRRSV